MQKLKSLMHRHLPGFGRPAPKPVAAGSETRYQVLRPAAPPRQEPVEQPKIVPESTLRSRIAALPQAKLDSSV